METSWNPDTKVHHERVTKIPLQTSKYFVVFLSERSQNKAHTPTNYKKRLFFLKFRWRKNSIIFRINVVRLSSKRVKLWKWKLVFLFFLLQYFIWCVVCCILMLTSKSCLKDLTWKNLYTTRAKVLSISCLKSNNLDYSSILYTKHKFGSHLCI